MIEHLNKIKQFNDTAEFMQDDELTEALVLIVKIIERPDIPPHAAVPLINKLQAYSAKFGLLATWYGTVEKDRAGTVNNTKKQVYYTMRESLDKLVDGLKYSARFGIRE